MPIFAASGPIIATVIVAGAQVRVTASDQTDTVVLVEPINKASQSDVKVANKTKVDFADGQLSVKTTVSGDKNGSVAITIDLPAGSGLVAYLAHSDVHADGSHQCTAGGHRCRRGHDRPHRRARQHRRCGVRNADQRGPGQRQALKLGRADLDRPRLGRPRSQQWQRQFRHRPRRRQRHCQDRRRRHSDRPTDTRSGGAFERLRKHRGWHQRGHRCTGGRQQRARVGAQLRSVAGEP